MCQRSRLPEFQGGVSLDEVEYFAVEVCFGQCRAFRSVVVDDAAEYAEEVGFPVGKVGFLESGRLKEVGQINRVDGCDLVGGNGGRVVAEGGEAGVDGRAFDDVFSVARRGRISAR